MQRSLIITLYRAARAGDVAVFKRVLGEMEEMNAKKAPLSVSVSACPSSKIVRNICVIVMGREKRKKTGGRGGGKNPHHANSVIFPILAAVIESYTLFPKRNKWPRSPPRPPAIMYTMAMGKNEEDSPPNVDVLWWLATKYKDISRQCAIVNKVIGQGKWELARVLREQAHFAIDGDAFPAAAIVISPEGEEKGDDEEMERRVAFLEWLIKTGQDDAAGETPIDVVRFDIEAAIPYIPSEVLRRLHAGKYSWRPTLTHYTLVKSRRLDLLEWMHDASDVRYLRPLLPRAQYIFTDCISHALRCGYVEILEWFYCALRCRCSENHQNVHPDCREFWDEYGPLWIRGEYVSDASPFPDVKPAKRKEEGAK